MVAAGAPARHRRSVRLRQIADAEDDRRHRGLRPRQRPARRPRHRFARTGGARHRLCAAKLRTVSPSHRVGATGVPGRRRSGSGQALDRPARPARPRKPATGRAVARPATTRRLGARAGAPCPSVLLDEPFSALDAPLRARLRREMLALQSELSATTILVTHDPAEAAMLADEILVFENGRALQSGPTDQVFRRPNNETVARLLGAGSRGQRHRRRRRQHRGRRRCGAPGHRTGADARRARRLDRVAGARALKRNRPLRGHGRGRHPRRVRPSDHVAFRRRIDRRRRRLHRSAAGSACRFDIDPDAVRIWPLESELSRTPDYGLFDGEYAKALRGLSWN